MPAADDAVVASWQTNAADWAGAVRDGAFLVRDYEAVAAGTHLIQAPRRIRLIHTPGMPTKRGSAFTRSIQRRTPGYGARSTRPWCASAT